MLSTVPSCNCGLVLITKAKWMWRRRAGSGSYLDPVGVKHTQFLMRTDGATITLME